MGRPAYSEDLRQKVIKHIEEGNSLRETAKLYKINKSTIVKWLKRYREEGHVEERKRPGSAPSIDIEEFKRYVEANKNKSAEKIVEAFGLNTAGAWYWLNKLGYRYKKKLQLPGSRSRET